MQVDRDPPNTGGPDEADAKDNDSRKLKAHRQATDLGVRSYVWKRWTPSTWPDQGFDPASNTPPITLSDVPLDSAVFTRGKNGRGPFERVLIKRGADADD
jgi:hypothetical protein